MSAWTAFITQLPLSVSFQGFLLYLSKGNIILQHTTILTLCFCYFSKRKRQFPSRTQNPHSHSILKGPAIWPLNTCLRSLRNLTKTQLNSVACKSKDISCDLKSTCLVPYPHSFPNNTLSFGRPVSTTELLINKMTHKWQSTEWSTKWWHQRGLLVNH